MTPPIHLQRIDVLRGIAIAAVIVFHFYVAAFGYVIPEYRGWWWALYPLGMGWTGVPLFFVISGYVIHRSYLLDKSFTWTGFAIRRFWRIYPAYFAALVAFGLMTGTPFSSADFVLHALLIHNLDATTFLGDINGSFWSLAVECQLYALYPLAVFTRNLCGVRGMMLFGCVAAGVWTVGAYAVVDTPLSQPGYVATLNVWYSPIALWPAWLVGAVLAEHHLCGKRLFKYWQWWALGCAIFFVAGQLWSWELFPPTGWFSIASLGAAVIFEAYVASGKVQGETWLRPLALIGLCSYSVYLLHQPLIPPLLKMITKLGITYPPMQIIVGCPVFFPLIFAIGWVSYVVIERCCMGFGQSALTKLARVLPLQWR